MDESFKKLFFISVGRSVSATLVVLVLFHVLLSGNLSFQEEKNIQKRLLISEKITDLMQYELRQENMVRSQTRLHFMATLRRANKDAAFILQELAMRSSISISFTMIKWQDGILWIKGYTQSDLAFANWMDAIKKSGVLFHPVITSLENKNSQLYFELRAGLKA